MRGKAGGRAQLWNRRDNEFEKELLGTSGRKGGWKRQGVMWSSCLCCCVTWMALGRMSRAGRQTVKKADCHAYEVAEGGSESLTKTWHAKETIAQATAKVTRLDRTCSRGGEKETEVEELRLQMARMKKMRQRESRGESSSDLQAHC